MMGMFSSLMIQDAPSNTSIEANENTDDSDEHTLNAELVAVQFAEAMKIVNEDYDSDFPAFDIRNVDNEFSLLDI